MSSVQSSARQTSPCSVGGKDPCLQQCAEACQWLVLQSSTLAASVAVGNTISTLAPQLAGAIDIVVVEQPDGSLRSSPFYGAPPRLFLGHFDISLCCWRIENMPIQYIARSVSCHWRFFELATRAAQCALASTVGCGPRTGGSSSQSTARTCLCAIGDSFCHCVVWGQPLVCTCAESL